MGALDFLSDYFSISTQKKKRKPMQVFMSSYPLCVCVFMVVCLKQIRILFSF